MCTVKRTLCLVLCAVAAILVIPVATANGQDDPRRLQEIPGDFEIQITEDDSEFTPPIVPFVVTPSPCAGGQTAFNGQMAVAQANKRTFRSANRIFRNAVASTCAGKLCPGNFVAPIRNHDVWEFAADTVDRCMTVAFNGGTCGSTFDAHPSAFCGFYPSNVAFPVNCNPAPGVAYKGDTGSTPGTNAIITFRFCIAANTTWSLLVSNSNTDLANCNYSFNVSCASQTCTPDPNCGAPPPSGGCNLAPIEAKLDKMEPKLDRLALDLAALRAEVAAGFAASAEAHCEIIRLLHTPAGVRATDHCGGHTWNEGQGNPDLP